MDKRITAALLIGGILLLTTGCGDMLSESVKNGIYNWVSGSLSADLISSGLLDLIIGR